jgi:DNA polymerase-1
MSERILAIDGNSILNRTYYAIPWLTNTRGETVHGVIGFFNILLKNIKIYQPTSICVAFDVSRHTFRTDFYPEYKGTRKKTPDELIEQLGILKDILQVMGIECYEKDNFEADDILGTIATYADENNHECYILTGDKDDLQLASDNVSIVLVVTKSGDAVDTLMTADDIMAKYGVTPAQFIDAKAIMGDSSDNIPGVKGLAEKTAMELIAKYKTLDNVYANLDNLRTRVKNLLEADKENAYKSQHLSTIIRNVPIDYSPKNFDISQLKDKNVLDKLHYYGLRSLENKLGAVEMEQISWF